MGKRIVDEEMRFTVIINGNEAQKELYNLEKSTRELTSTNKLLRAERAKLQKAGKRDSVAYKNLTTEINKNSTTIGENKTRMAALQKQIGITGLTMGQLRKKASMLRLQLHNMVPGSALFKKLDTELKAVNTRLAQLRGNAKATEGSLSKLAGGFNKFQALGFAVIAMVTGVVLSLQKFIDFNGKLSDSMSDVQKTTGMTKKEVDDLAKSFGILHTRTSRIDLLKIAEEGGRIGIVKEEIADFVAIMDKAVVALGDTFPGGAEETASKLGKLKLLFKETKDQKVDKAYNAIGSAINELGANGVATEVNIANFATRVGSLPNALKPSIATALALGAGFEESGIQAEIAARAYGIVITQAAQETEKFANVMGLSKKAVDDLINEDPVEFMIKFADGLTGMNATETAQTLDYLGVKATGASKVLGSLSNNTNRFRELMEMSNTSMIEGTSLIKEYNVKNNNLAGTLDKVGKRLKGILTSQTLSKALDGLVTGFGKLIGAIKDVNKEFAHQSKLSFENARNNRKLANESQNLLERYEELTKDGIKPTNEAKEELDEITLKLSDRLGKSVMTIDAETGAFKLNTDAVREQIKLKRFAADDEASTLASRLKGTEEAIKGLDKEKEAAQKLFDIRNRAFERDNKEDLEGLRGSSIGGREAKQQLMEQMEGYQELQNAKKGLRDINVKIIEQQKREVDLAEKLSELNFSPEDVANLFKVAESDGLDGPKEGDTRQVGGVTFIFKNGKWEMVRIFVPPTTSTGGKDNTNDILKENLRLKAQLIQGDFFRELTQLQTNHQIKIKELEKQLVTEGKLTEEQMIKNGAIREQIRLLQETFQFKKENLALKHIEKDLNQLIDKYDRAAKIRRANFDLELAELELTDKERKAKQEGFDREELLLKAQHTQEVIDKVNEIMSSEDFQGIDLEILTEEQKQALVRRLEDLGLSITEINSLLALMQGKGELVEGNDFDVFGFTVDQWEEAFTNLDTLEGKLNAAAMGVQGLMNTYQFMYDLQSQNEQRRFKEFDKYNTAQRTKLKQRLDAGIINERQYDAALQALDRQKAEMEYQAAKRAHKNQVMQAIGNTALAVINGLMTTPFMPLGIAMGAMAGILGGLQVAAVSKNKPVKGFEEGYGYDKFPVEREQDGKMFNASYGGAPKSGMVNEPTILVGEMPELIITNPDLKRFNPAVTQSLANELARVRGFETGHQGTALPTPSAPASQSNEVFESLLALNTEVLLDLRENGVIALLSRDMENTQKLKEDLDKLNKYRKKAELNGVQ